jgi:hypothetical protein
MPTHRITLTNTSQNTHVLSPTTSPLTLLLDAQRSGSFFDYGSTFINVVEALLEVDDTQSPVLTLDWAGAVNPNWGMALVSGSTSCSIVVVGTSTKFTFTVPTSGQSEFDLTPGGAAGTIKVKIKRK